MKPDLAKYYNMAITDALESLGIDYCDFTWNDEIMFIFYVSESKRGAMFANVKGEALISAFFGEELDDFKKKKLLNYFNTHKEIDELFSLDGFKSGDVVMEYKFSIPYDNALGYIKEKIHRFSSFSRECFDVVNV